MSELEPGMVKITVSVEDKIGLPQFSSIMIGSSLTRLVPESDDETLKAEYQKSFKFLEEEILAYEREKVLGELQT